MLRPCLLPLLLLLAVVGGVLAFECFTCNSDPHSDDTRECVDKKEMCPKGVESCSMVTYLSKKDDKIHTRKFCTSPGTPIYQYLFFFPGSALCQNIDTKNDNVKFGSELLPPPLDEDAPLVRAKRVRRGEPPAPPHEQTNSLLCVCSTNLCNGGSYTEVLERSMRNNVNRLPDRTDKKTSSDNHLQEIA